MSQKPKTIDEILRNYKRHCENSVLFKRMDRHDLSCEEAKQALAEWVRSKKPHPTGLQKAIHPQGVELELIDRYEQALLADLEEHAKETT
jgi:hypothetical protein